jgi:FixJ family two-component response regulator
VTTDVIVHLVDDDPHFLKSLARLLSCEGFQVLACESGPELLERVTAQSRGCIVADLQMPGMDGLSLQAALAELNCRMPVIFLTGVGDITSTVRAMRGGAADFIEKIAPKAVLLDAIHRALDQYAREMERYAHRDALARRIETLTRREREVLSEVVLGRMNKQIAAKLGITERTVKMHRTSITTKVGVHSTAQLTTFAHAAGLLEIPTINAKQGSGRN